ncbi:hypothetical protein BKA70DRAFT_1214144 [Coprinopsis sp. MPI-PUGE-AT-0042]|nr:hypothetical protein BKA70DRAFT_1214144 [Coprinopsis sp. MPI-PUGE-AT-0042]
MHSKCISRLTPSLLTCIRSFDVWLIIAAFLQPYDLLALRKTCSFLYEVTQRRALWLAVARRMTQSHGLLSSSFPFQKLSLDELEHLALSPSRMEKLILSTSSSDRNPTARPVQTRCMSLCRNHSGDELDMEVDDLHLLPGGRFLLTHHTGDGIYLWDLGHNAAVPPRMRPLASLHFASGVVDLEMDPPIPTSDRHGVRVVCHWSETSYGASPANHVGIYELYPASGKPSFVSVARGRSTETLDVLSKANDLVVLQQGRNVIVWDYTQKLAHKWQTKHGYEALPLPGISTDETPPQVAMFGTTLVALESENITVMEARPRYPCDGDFDSLAPSSDALPSLTLPRPENSKISFLHTSDWLEHPTNDHVLCLLVSDTVTKSVHLQAYRVLPLRESQEVALPSILPVAASLPSVIFPECPSIYASGNNQLWRSPTTGRFFMTCISYRAPQSQLAIVGCQLAPSTSAPLSSVNMKLSKYSAHSPHSFCYATGRMVSFEESRMSDGVRRELRIVDFLGPRLFYDD